MNVVRVHVDCVAALCYHLRSRCESRIARGAGRQIVHIDEH